MTQLITLADWGLFLASAWHAPGAETQRWLLFLPVIICPRHQITKSEPKFLLLLRVGPPAALFLSGDISDTV